MLTLDAVTETLTDGVDTLAKLTELAQRTDLARAELSDPRYSDEHRRTGLHALNTGALDEAMQIAAGVRDRLTTALASESYYAPESVRRRATFTTDETREDTVALRWVTQLARAPLGEIVETVADAVARGNVALAFAAQRELLHRSTQPGAGEAERTAALEGGRHYERLPVPEICTEAARAFGNVRGLLRHLDNAIGSISGRRISPEARLAAAHASRPRKVA